MTCGQCIYFTERELERERELELMTVRCDHAEGCERSGGACSHLVPHEYQPYDMDWDCAGQMVGPCMWGDMPIEAKCVPVEGEV